MLNWAIVDVIGREAYKRHPRNVLHILHSDQHFAPRHYFRLLSPEGAFLYFTWFVFFTVRGTDTAYKSGTLHLKLAHGVTIARGDRYCL